MSEFYRDSTSPVEDNKYEVEFKIKESGEIKKLLGFSSIEDAYKSILQSWKLAEIDKLEIRETKNEDIPFCLKEKYKYPHNKIKHIFEQVSDDLPSILDKYVSVVGWVKTVRTHASDAFAFCSLNDGSTSESLQIIVNKENEVIEGSFDDFYQKASTGVSLRAFGKIIKSPAKGQLIELVAETILIEGTVENPDTYPVAKKKFHLETMRGMCHLRPRTNVFGNVFRLRNALTVATHEFYQKRDFLHLDPNVISINECEGGAGVFTVSELDFDSQSQRAYQKIDWKKDHFNKRAFLTVSSQLQLEALACSMGNVYTTNKSFRSEHSLTSKHVSEFTHLEIEQCFTSFKDLMDIGEDYVKYVIDYVLKNNFKELSALNAYQSKGLIDRLTAIRDCDFHRMTYKEAIEIIQEDLKAKKVKMTTRPKIGDDLGTEHENYLTKKFEKPVFVTHWPSDIKSFYMKQCDDGTCESFDLIMPFGVGELIGASQREESYDKLLEMMTKKGIDKKDLEFYLDLRKYGTCQHGGFGLGMDRFLMLLTGMNSIKDVIPFPVYYTSCMY